MGTLIEFKKAANLLKNWQLSIPSWQVFGKIKIARRGWFFHLYWSFQNHRIFVDLITTRWLLQYFFTINTIGMKIWPRLSAIICLLVVSLYSAAQDAKPFTIQLLTPQGSPITDARLIVPSGQEHRPNEEGIIVYHGEDDYVKKNGKYVKTKVMPRYITIKSSSFKEMQIDLSKYSVGADIILTMQRLDPETKALLVHVVNRKAKPIPDAFISVIPGTSTSTDAAGKGRTTHTQEWGEYITVNVSATGYKTMEKKLMAGRNRKTSGGLGSMKTPDDEIVFILDMTDQTMPLIIEVLDSETDKPVLAAKVVVTATNGAAVKGVTGTNGLAQLKVPESGFKGTTSRVVVTKTGYEEKWSDIDAELMTGKGAARKFLVYIKKPCTMVGTWEQSTEHGIPTTKWTITADGKAKESGGGNAKGDATFTGGKLRIVWTTNDNYAGYYEWDLEDCKSGNGNLVFTKSGVGTHKSTVKRL